MDETSSGIPESAIYVNQPNTPEPTDSTPIEPVRTPTNPDAPQTTSLAESRASDKAFWALSSARAALRTRNSDAQWPNTVFNGGFTSADVIQNLTDALAHPETMTGALNITTELAGLPESGNTIQLRLKDWATAVLRSREPTIESSLDQLTKSPTGPERGRYEEVAAANAARQALPRVTRAFEPKTLNETWPRTDFGGKLGSVMQDLATALLYPGTAKDARAITERLASLPDSPDPTLRELKSWATAALAVSADLSAATPEEATPEATTLNQDAPRRVSHAEANAEYRAFKALTDARTFLRTRDDANPWPNTLARNGKIAFDALADLRLAFEHPNTRDGALRIAQQLVDALPESGDFAQDRLRSWATNALSQAEPATDTSSQSDTPPAQ